MLDILLYDIRAIEKRQDEQQNHLKKITEECQGNEISFKKVCGSFKSWTQFIKSFKILIKQIVYLSLF